MNMISLLASVMFLLHPSPKPIPLQPDTARYSILKFDRHRDSFLFDSTYRAANVNDADVKKIEKIIKVAVKEYNHRVIHSKKPVAVSPISRPDKYYKQIIATTNSRGEKVIWVNCFCTPSEKKYWRKGVVMILDGGPCFFNIKINLATNTVLSMEVNGVA